MKPEIRADLRKWFDAGVRMSEVFDDFLQSSFDFNNETGLLTVRDPHGYALPGLDGITLPPLPPEKVLALSVLLGDPATLPQALADYLIDIGHDSTVAAYERGKAESVAGRTGV